MKKIKAVIVEDSRLARNELKELIKNHPEIQIIGEGEREYWNGFKEKSY